MEAKDTVMTAKEMGTWLYGKPLDKDYELLKREAQAEISFKAGIREVVEWIQANSIIYRVENLDYECSWIADQLLVLEGEWQDQLKTWGIEEVAP